MQPHEVLLNVHIPFTKQHDFVREYKQAHRRDDDIAIANAGMRVRMEMATDGNHPPPPQPPHPISGSWLSSLLAWVTYIISSGARISFLVMLARTDSPLGIAML